MSQKTIDLGYKPRSLQSKLHREMQRFNVLVIHRRAGKTHLSLMELLDKALRNPLKKPQYAYISPTFKQSKRVAWEILKGYAHALPGFESNESELRIDFKRPHMGDSARIYLLGAEDPGSLRGLYLDGVVLDEYAEMGPDLWATVIRPALADRLGWAIFIGTPRGCNHFKDMYDLAGQTEGWYRAIHKASETGIIPISELEAARAIMSDEEYNQEFECDWSAALIGAYFGKEMKAVEDDKRVTLVRYQPGFPVDTWWDLGIGDSMAIWFSQTVGKEIHLIDYIEDSGRDIEYYVRQLQDRKYVYGDHCLPHDAAARELGTGKTRQEIFTSLGFRTKILPKQSLEDGIDAVRRILPRCWFDGVKCDRGINALKNYEKKWDSKNKIYSSHPLHNWASHGADAFRTLAMGLRESTNQTRWKDLPMMADNKYDIFQGRRR